MNKPSLCKNILIAEDNDDVRETMEAVLKLEGYKVYSSKNGPTESVQDQTPLKTSGALKKPLDLTMLLDTAREYCSPAL